MVPPFDACSVLTPGAPAPPWAGGRTMDSDLLRSRFRELLGRPFAAEELFDLVPDIVFFVKDGAGRYLAVNRTLLERCGLRRRGEALGRTAAELFPPPLGEAYAAQDRALLATGAPIRDQLELHLYPNGGRGWCLTCKTPLRDPAGRIIGLCGISRDLQGQPGRGGGLERLARVIDHIHGHLDRPLRLGALAAMAGLSAYQLDQRIRALFRLSARQYLVRTRIEAACDRLARGDQPVARIAQACGYSDRSAFARQFRQTVGISPLAYRRQARGRPG